VFSKIKHLKTPKCPFANLPETSSGRWGQGLTAEKMRGCVWLKPETVVRIDFAEWTGANKLRHYVFELTTSSSELNTKKFIGNLALHSVKSSGKTRHSFPVS
jgi:ATP-dependent DNA ligase